MNKKGIRNVRQRKRFGVVNSTRNKSNCAANNRSKIHTTYYSKAEYEAAPLDKITRNNEESEDNLSGEIGEHAQTGIMQVKESCSCFRLPQQFITSDMYPRITFILTSEVNLGSLFCAVLNCK